MTLKDNLKKNSSYLIVGSFPDIRSIDIWKYLEENITGCPNIE